jgi:hypothetical protein
LGFGVTVLYAFHLTWCEKQKGDSVKCQQDIWGTNVLDRAYLHV